VDVIKHTSDTLLIPFYIITHLPPFFYQTFYELNLHMALSKKHKKFSDYLMSFLNAAKLYQLWLQYLMEIHYR